MSPGVRFRPALQLRTFLEQLASEDATERAEARDALLRRLDLTAVAQGVAEMLAASQPHVRRAAAEVLRELGPVAGPALPRILPLLEDPEPALRAEAALLLAALGEGACAWDLAEALMRAAHDPVYAVRKAAVYGLHRIGPMVRARSASPDPPPLPNPRPVPPRPAPPSETSSPSQRAQGTTAPEHDADDEADEAARAAPTPPWVQGLAEELGAHVTPRRDAYVLTLPVGGGRLQRVRLSVDDHPRGLTISTECGPVRPEQYGWALETNLLLSPGRLALRRETKEGRHDELVLLATVPLDEALPRVTAELVRRLAEQGDAFEQRLTGGDER